MNGESQHETSLLGTMWRATQSGRGQDRACAQLRAELLRIATAALDRWAHRDDVEDAVQNVLLRLLRPYKFRGQTDSEARAFLRTALVRQYVTSVRSRAHLVPSGAAGVDYAAGASGASLEGQVMARQRLAAACAGFDRFLRGHNAARSKDAAHISRRMRRYLAHRGLVESTEVFPAGRSSAEAKAEFRSIQRLVATTRHATGVDVAMDREICAVLLDLRGA